MRIKAIKIEPAIVIKIFEKHDIQQDEVVELLKEDYPTFRKVGGDQYLAMGLAKSRYVTIYFRYDTQTEEAEITTAYPSDGGQIKSYKRWKHDRQT